MELFHDNKPPGCVTSSFQRGFPYSINSRSSFEFLNRTFSLYNMKCLGMKQLLWFTIFSLVEYIDAAESQKSSLLTQLDPPAKSLLCCFQEHTARQLHGAGRHRSQGPRWEGGSLPGLFMFEPINYFSSTQHSVTFHFHFTASVSKLQLLGIFKPYTGRLFSACSVLAMMPFHTTRGLLGGTDVVAEVRGHKRGHIPSHNFLMSTGSASWTQKPGTPNVSQKRMACFSCIQLLNFFPTQNH